MERQREAMRPRLFPAIPPKPVVCFIPMTGRGEYKNWYKVPFEERAADERARMIGGAMLTK